MSVHVHIAVNDENGNFTGELHQIEFVHPGDIVTPMLRLESQFMPDSGAHLEYTPEGIRVNGSDFPTRGGIGHWVGNVCWDSVMMARIHAEHLAKYLLELKYLGVNCFSVDEGWSEIWDRWEQSGILSFETKEADNA